MFATPALTSLLSPLGCCGYHRVLLIGCLLWLLSPCLHAVSTWTENAEAGAGGVIDGSAASYSLIQSVSVAEGAAAFHLANPSFTDGWFELNVDIDVQADSKLFFSVALGLCDLRSSGDGPTFDGWWRQLASGCLFSAGNRGRGGVCV